jgi:hypothetical protein
MDVFWVAASIIALMMAAGNASESSAKFCKTTRRYNPEGNFILISARS